MNVKTIENFTFLEQSGDMRNLSFHNHLDLVQFLPQINGRNMIEMTEREKARFWTKAKQGPTCWEWQFSLSPNGYGVFGHRGKTIKAHRAAYKLVNGELLQSQCVLHTCDNPKCINPDHLVCGSQKDNMHDMIRKKRFRLGKYSRFHGVKFRANAKRENTKRWMAYVTIEKKIVNLGSFHSEVDAAKVVDKYRVEVMKMPYRLNFPEDWVQGGSYPQ